MQFNSTTTIIILQTTAAAAANNEHVWMYLYEGGALVAETDAINLTWVDFNLLKDQSLKPSIPNSLPHYLDQIKKANTDSLEILMHH